LCLLVFLGGPAFAQELDLLPSNPLAMPGTNGGVSGPGGSLYLDGRMLSGILPSIPNLEIGYLYDFGDRVSTGRLSLDYVLPLPLGRDGVGFGEFHGEFVRFWKTLGRVFKRGNTTTTLAGYRDRTDLSIGGGYRKLLGDSLVLGVNGFYDASQLGGGRWFGSGGAGLEMVGLVAGGDSVDLNFNYYGNLFSGRNSIVNAFRNGTGNFDLELGYSHRVGDSGPDLRVKVTGYRFDAGTKVYGWNAGAQVSTSSGLLSVRADAGRDRLNGTYYTVGGFVNVGLQLGRLLQWRNPFTAPEPVFRSPRNLRRLLVAKVRRNWHQPAAVVLARSSTEQGGTGHVVGVYTGTIQYSYGYTGGGTGPSPWHWEKMVVLAPPYAYQGSLSSVTIEITSSVSPPGLNWLYVGTNNTDNPPVPPVPYVMSAAGSWHNSTTYTSGMTPLRLGQLGADLAGGGLAIAIWHRSGAGAAWRPISPITITYRLTFLK
jgi:hypothetical protein